jgi:hypothetical protein
LVWVSFREPELKKIWREFPDGTPSRNRFRRTRFGPNSGSSWDFFVSLYRSASRSTGLTAVYLWTSWSISISPSKLDSSVLFANKVAIFDYDMADTDPSRSHGLHRAYGSFTLVWHLGS